MLMLIWGAWAATFPIWAFVWSRIVFQSHAVGFEDVTNKPPTKICGYASTERHRDVAQHSIACNATAAWQLAYCEQLHNDLLSHMFCTLRIVYVERFILFTISPVYRSRPAVGTFLPVSAHHWKQTCCKPDRDAIRITHSKRVIIADSHVKSFNES